MPFQLLFLLLNTASYRPVDQKFAYFTKNINILQSLCSFLFFYYWVLIILLSLPNALECIHFMSINTFHVIEWHTRCLLTMLFQGMQLLLHDITWKFGGQWRYLFELIVYYKKNNVKHSCCFFFTCSCCIGVSQAARIVEWSGFITQ